VIKKALVLVLAVIVGGATVLVYQKIDFGGRKPAPLPVAAVADLAAHTEEFRQEVIAVTKGVYVAVGFGLANSVLLEGDDGVVIVDTMESAEAAQPVKQAFSRITAKPVKAIIYTHFHTDHTNGTRVMAGSDHPEIISHETTLAHLDRVINLTRDITYKRAMRQFGALLPAESLVNAGIGPRLVFNAEAATAPVRPTRTFTGQRLALTVAGIDLVLLHVPGETPDQIAVWLPAQKVLLPADNYYKSFPNLYAIRGTAYRDVMLWVKSLDTLRGLKASFLVPHHTRPLVGEGLVFETLTNYRDAIQFVHDQTIRWMNEGLGPEAIVEKVHLPARLAALPYLQPFYGTVAWSVRAIFDGYLGWFGGNATDLYPLGPARRAAHIAALAGGPEALLSRAREVTAAGDHQWVLELADHLLALNPDDREAKRLKANALRAVARSLTAATGRNYCLTQALETEGTLHIGRVTVHNPEIVQSIALEGIFEAMRVSLDPEKCGDADQVVGFRFPDTGEAFTVHVRHGVADVQPGLSGEADNTVTVDSTVWKQIAAGLRSPTAAFAAGQVTVDGGTLDLVRFLRWFKRGSEGAPE
jgi:alkyl sulfatase BDS1-like metallo-beta-lactamase superfamily hydrolase